MILVLIVRTLLFSFVFCSGPVLTRSQLTTSLYIPGFDPQPISAHVIGVGSDGRTTWALHQGKADATDTSIYPDFIGTATLVEGPSDAALTYANSRAQLTIAEGCTFSESTLAICTIVAQGSSVIQTDVARRVPVQLPSPGGLTTGTTGTATASESPTNGGASMSSDSTTPSQTQTGTLPPTSGDRPSALRGGSLCLICMQILVIFVCIFVKV